MSSTELLIKSVLGALKLRPIHFVAGTVISSIALFAPDSILKSIFILDFVQIYKMWIGLFFLICSSVVALYLAILIYRTLMRNYYYYKNNKIMYNKLQNLTEDEKQILRFYIAKQTKTNSLRYNDGVVRGLEFYGIIFRSSTMGSLLHGFSYNINETAWDYINNNPNVLYGTTNTYRTDESSYFR